VIIYNKEKLGLWTGWMSTYT